MTKREITQFEAQENADWEEIGLEQERLWAAWLKKHGIAKGKVDRLAKSIFDAANEMKQINRKQAKQIEEIREKLDLLGKQSHENTEPLLEKIQKEKNPGWVLFIQILIFLAIAATCTICYFHSFPI